MKEDTKYGALTGYKSAQFDIKVLIPFYQVPALDSRLVPTDDLLNNKEADTNNSLTA
jgi:hypothetical protein